MEDMQTEIDDLRRRQDLGFQNLERKFDNLDTKFSWYLSKKYKGAELEISSESKDENPDRGNWSGKYDFILSCIGYAVGLGNVWRFPFLAYRHGGGAFYIPYWIMLIFIGMPILMLEFSLGQFSSRSSATAWRFARIFSGIGLAQAIVSGMVAIYYNMIIAWAAYYMLLSFTKIPDLPWSKCKEPWATKWCMDYLNLTWSGNASDCLALGPTFSVMNMTGVCYNNSMPWGYYNLTLASENNLNPRVPTEDYLNNEVLHKSASMDETGYPQWKLVVALLFAWVLVFFCMIKGIKSSGKVVYFTATFPYVILLILLIRGLLLPGMKEGLLFYVKPDPSRLTDIDVWRDAAKQIFFSLSASWGGLITLSSYNRFHNNTLRDALIVSLADTLTSMFAGCVIFSYVGFLSQELDVEVENVFEGGSTLAFQVYPYAVTKLPASPLWAVLFFFMLIILGLDSQFVLVETVLSSFLDTWPKQLRKHKTPVLAGLCLVFFVLGLTLTTPSGTYWLDLLDDFSGGWNLMFIALLECVGLCYVYGFRRFRNDIRIMIGEDACICCGWSTCSWWWAPMWGFFSPAGVLALVVYTWIKYESNPKYPLWAEVLGWLMTMVVLSAVFIVAVVMVCKYGCRASVTPPTDWGPALVRHRRLVTYVPNFVVDLHEDGDIGDFEVHENKGYM